MPRNRRKAAAPSPNIVSLHEEVSTKSEEELMNEKFVLISFQSATCIQRRFIPCEMGILVFSLKDGIQFACHTFVSPMPLPRGSQAEAKSFAESTHKIPLYTDFPYWNDQFDAISERISMALGSGQNRVFARTDGDEHKIIKDSLAYLNSRSKDRLPEIQICSIERLVECIAHRFKIYTDSADAIGNYLRRTAHDYDDGVRCHFHLGNDNFHCAYASVLRLYFNIMDFFGARKGMTLSPSVMTIPPQFVSVAPFIANAEFHRMAYQNAELDAFRGVQSMFFQVKESNSSSPRTDISPSAEAPMDDEGWNSPPSFRNVWSNETPSNDSWNDAPSLASKGVVETVWNVSECNTVNDVPTSSSNRVQAQQVRDAPVGLLIDLSEPATASGYQRDDGSDGDSRPLDEFEHGEWVLGPSEKNYRSYTRNHPGKFESSRRFMAGDN